MPLYWYAASQAPKVSQMTQQAQQQLVGVLTLLGATVLGAVAYFFGENDIMADLIAFLPALEMTPWEELPDYQ